MDITQQKIFPVSVHIEISNLSLFLVSKSGTQGIMMNTYRDCMLYMYKDMELVYTT